MPVSRFGIGRAVGELVDGIQYHKLEARYEMSEWVEEEESVSDRLVPVDNSIHDYIVCESEVDGSLCHCG